jgi:hypothetical protein
MGSIQSESLVTHAARFHRPPEIAHVYGPSVGALGYGYATRSAWSFVVAGIYALLHDPVHRILIAVAEKVGPALGERAEIGPEASGVLAA